MRSSSVLILLLLLAFGCGKSTPNTPSVSNPSPNVNRQADNYIAAWQSMGMYLPDDQQIAFFESNLPQTQNKVIAALASPESDVRQRAAHVISGIGVPAQACGPALLNQLKSEKDRLVRIYLINALAAVEFRGPAAVSELESRFQTLTDDNVPRNLLDSDYEDVDEKIRVAAALYVLKSGKDRDQYFDFVTKWLQPPPSGLTPDELRGYWERLWMAVISLEHMPGATSAIPLLELMQTEKDAESWVGFHVPRVIKTLQTSNNP